MRFSRHMYLIGMRVFYEKMSDLPLLSYLSYSLIAGKQGKTVHTIARSRWSQSSQYLPQQSSMRSLGGGQSRLIGNRKQKKKNYLTIGLVRRFSLLKAYAFKQ